MLKRVTLFFAVLSCCLPLTLCASAEKNHARDCYYALVTPASSGFPDTGRKLTDGKTGVRIPSGKKEYYYKDDAFVGFNRISAQNGCFTIIIDLTYTVNDIARFEVSALCETDIGIYEPEKIVISVSDIFGGEYMPVAECQNSVRTDGGISETCVLSVTPQKTASGRYVRFDIYCTDDRSGWVFIDELRVMGGNKAKTETVFADTALQNGRKHVDVGYLPWILIGVGCGLIAYTVLRRNAI